MFLANPETGIRNLSFHRSTFVSNSDLRCRLAPRHHLPWVDTTAAVGERAAVRVDAEAKQRSSAQREPSELSVVRRTTLERGPSLRRRDGARQRRKTNPRADAMTTST